MMDLNINHVLTIMGGFPHIRIAAGIGEVLYYSAIAITDLYQKNRVKNNLQSYEQQKKFEEQAQQIDIASPFNREANEKIVSVCLQSQQANIHRLQNQPLPTQQQNDLANLQRDHLTAQRIANDIKAVNDDIDETISEISESIPDRPTTIDRLPNQEKLNFSEEIEKCEETMLKLNKKILKTTLGIFKGLLRMTQIGGLTLVTYEVIQLLRKENEN